MSDISQKRILVVDDEPDIVYVLKKALEREGFTVDSFTRPQEALDHFKPDYYAVGVIDIRMPEMNGFQFYREMKKKDDKIKVAFMTAFDIYENEFNTVFKNTNVSMFFKKPVSVNKMVEKIKEQLENA